MAIICNLVGNQSDGKNQKLFYHPTEWIANSSTLFLANPSVYILITERHSEDYMAQQGVEELVIHLENTMDLSRMEQGVKLVGAVLVNRQLNRWGVRNILRSSWKAFGEIEVKWVRDNLYIITVPDESVAATILNQVPWVVMKQNFSVKRWPQELALEKIRLESVLFGYKSAAYLSDSQLN